jgi:hypothetical protein
MNLTLTQMEQVFLDDLQANVATDPVFTAVSAAGDARRQLNDAYRILWDKSGSRLKTAAHATLWSTVVASGTRRLAGTLTGIAEIVQLWNTATSGSTGGDLVDVLMFPTDIEEIQFNRTHSSATTGVGTYAAPLMYAAVRAATVTAADVGKLTLEFWPDATGALFFPAHYIAEFTEMAAGTDVADVNGIESYDIPHLAALWNAAASGREDLLETIAMKISESTQLLFERKVSAMLDARQNRARTA